MGRPRVLSVGQCSFDHSTISRWISATFEADAVGAHTGAEALATLRSGEFGLVLVNRVGDRDGAPGLDLIRSIKADPALAHLKVMLVSNFESAQKQAIDLGAISGFGKGDIGTDAADDVVREAIRPKKTTPASV